MEQHLHRTGAYEQVTANLIVPGNGKEIHFRVVLEYRKLFGRNKWIALYDSARIGVVAAVMGYCIAP